MSCPGRYIKIELNTADASSGDAIVPVILYDDQQNVITLGPDEMLRIDNLNIAVGADISVDLFADADDDDTVDAGERLASVGQGTHELDFGPEGIAVPTGVTPVVTASGSGGITVIGTGRIQNNRSPATRPSWREDTHLS